MAQDNDGWEEVTDPGEAHMAAASLLPAAPPTRASGKPPKAYGGGVSAQDRVLLNKYRDTADAADTFLRSAGNVEAVDQRFHTGAGKAAMFGAMYPDTSGWGGSLKAAGGALLRGTLGNFYSDQDHDDYQYLNAQTHALNNAGLRMNKGVQTEGDAQRIARENVGVDKAPAVNHGIIQAQMDSVALAHARDLSASKWAATFGGLTGTKNTSGLTYDEWFSQVVAPKALAHARGGTASAPAATAPGWGMPRRVR